MEINLFSQCVRNHRTMVFRIAYSYTKNTHDADDITQDVFLKLYKTENQFAADENIKAWLIRVTVNQAKSLIKTAWRVKRSDFSYSIENNTCIISSEMKGETPSDDRLDLQQYIEGLKPKYRTIIYLYYYEQYSVKEIADLLKIQTTTVTTQLSRARNQLKEILLTEW
ncbi:MAG: RNA polymerase sigma factor [Oscillospiraceae bacterium]|nr:RNA polymerase sigma factor [Oscillospiraceae bacterium]